MTGKPAIQVGLLFLMAFDAKTHLEVDTLDSVHGLHPPMTFLTNHLFLDVSLMIEKDMFRQIVGLSPRCRRFSIEVIMFFLYFRMIGDNIFVAVKAFFYRGNPWEGGTAYVGMTEFTLDLLYPGMDAMTESNRLHRTNVHGRCCVKRVKKQEDEKKTTPGN